MVSYTLGSSNIYERIKNKLLQPSLSQNISEISLATTNNFSKVFHSSFFDILNPFESVYDIVIGKIEGNEKEANHLFLIALKYIFLRYAIPLNKSFIFEKKNSWNINLQNTHEIVINFQKELFNLVSDLPIKIYLFYGRLDLELKTFTYFNCLENDIYFFNSQKNEVNLLKKYTQSLELLPPSQIQSHQIIIENNSTLIFSDFYEKNEEYNLLNIRTLLSDSHQLSCVQMADYFNQILKQQYENAAFLFIGINKTELEKKTKCRKAAFAADLCQLEAARNFVKQDCLKAPGDVEKLTLQVQLAINELFCNIVQHSYKSEKGEILIECLLTEEGLHVTLSDKGESFNPKDVDFPNLTGEQEDGFGLFIVQQIIDQMCYIPKSKQDEWNHLRFFKKYYSEEDIMDFSQRVENNITILTPLGESLDAKNVSSFKSKVLGIIQTVDQKKLIFDLHHLQFIDSSGLGALLSIQRTFNSQGGILKLSNLNKPIRTMFEIVSMHRIFDIFPSTEEAINSF